MSQPIVDFGAHYHPEQPGPMRPIHDFIDDADGNPICSDTDTIKQRYRAAGVDYAVLSQPFYMGSEDAATAAAANDALFEIVDAHEPFLGLASLPTAAGGEAAAAEFERALEMGYHGGALETTSDGIGLLDETVEPMLEVADRTGAPILVHPKLHDSLGEPVLDDAWQLNAIFGREAALASSICKVIHEGVYDRYPNLTLVFHHTGGNLSSMLPRVRLQLDEGRWPGLDGLKSPAEFEAQFAERVYLDSSGYFGERAPIRRTLETLPASNFLFATDFPYETRAESTFRKFVDAVSDVCSPPDVEKVLGGNALEILVNGPNTET
ncbi:amidohydrolase family protein [Halobellus sp. GM3]|uniref:amidohydrolase family protein n=1 Tax=Halobellus sp. GM3 TaxID=3458410 RepID=UPI00403DB7F0